jgi:hypothetical protein
MSAAPGLRRSCLLALMLLGPVAARAQDPKTKPGNLTPEQCTEFRAHYSPDSTLKGIRPAEAKQAIAMPKLPQDDLGKEFDIKVLVNVRGSVDSVRVGGIVSTTTEDRLRTVMMRYTFKSATWQGCAVPFWMTFSVRS